MKKLLVLMLALFAAVSISGCSKSTPKDADASSDKVAEAPAAADADVACDATKCGEGKCDCKDGDKCDCKDKDGGECKCNHGDGHKCGEGCKCGCKDGGECKCNHGENNDKGDDVKDIDSADETDAECKTDEECAAKTGDDYTGSSCIQGNERSTFCGCDDDDDCKEGYKCDDKLCVKG